MLAQRGQVRALGLRLCLARRPDLFAIAIQGTLEALSQGWRRGGVPVELVFQAGDLAGDRFGVVDGCQFFGAHADLLERLGVLVLGLLAFVALFLQVLEQRVDGLAEFIP